ncbi:MAG TPA: hypothetical protein VEI02_09785 [Planctomycetota bacterium]|nr:hypothetical protein [Planctomycetota bacterium]
MPRSLTACLVVAAVAAAGRGQSPATRPASPAASSRPAAPSRPTIPPARVPHATAPDVKGGWEAATPLEPAPAPPSLLFETGDVLRCASGDAIARYDPEPDRWTPRVARLPGRLGMGAAAAYDAATGTAYLLQGGDRGFWRYDLKNERVDALIRTPKPIGRGGALVVLGRVVYALRGAQTGEFYAYDLDRNVWSVLPNIGRRGPQPGPGDVKVVGAGFTSGFLVADQGRVFAWPDHHVQRFDVADGRWFERTWTSFGFRPNCDGAGFAWDRETRLLWATQGMDSNALASWDHPKQGPGFHLLRPRLPEPLHGEGSRAAVARRGGVKHLFVYAPEPRNKLWRIPLERLERIRPGSRAADVGSPYETFHEDNGSSLVRRAGPTAIEGVFAPFKDRFFFMRLEGLRLCDPVKDEWTEYPGTPLGAQITPGVFGVWDGADHVWYSTGGGDDDPRRPRPRRFGRLEPATKKAEEGPPMPGRPGRGSRAVIVDGALWALRGGATRDVYRFDLATRKWSSGPSLPEASAAPGAVGSGLAALGGALFAFPDETAWRLDLAAPEKGWTRFATLPWCCGTDGGMTAVDEVGGAVYVVRGDVTRSLGRLDVATGAFVRLAPDLPDVVSVEGERAVVRESEGERRLFIHRGHDSHEIWRVPLAALTPAP